MTRARNSANLASHGNLFVDITNDRTGIGSVVPDQNLHVAGTAGFHADVTFTGDLYNTTWDRSANSLRFNDSAQIKFGTGNDANIRHDGNNTWIQNGTGYLYIDAAGSSSGIRLISHAHWQAGAMAAFYKDGGVVLYHDANQKFSTTAYGTNITGTTDTDGLVVSGVATVTTMNVTGVLTYDDVTSVDSVGIVTARQGVRVTADGSSSSNYISAGAGDDLRIFHTGSANEILSMNGALYVKGDASNLIGIQPRNGENAALFYPDGAVELYHNNNLRVQTQTSRTVFRGSAGIAVYGDEGQNQNGQISIHPQGSAVYSNLFFYNAAGNAYASIIGHAGGTLFFTGGTNSPLRFRVNGTGHHSFQDGNTEKVRITVGGEVNIGGNFTQTTVPLCVTTGANDFGIRLMTGSNVVCEILNNDSAGNSEIRGYYNNNSGTRGEGYRLEANGETFFNPGGNSGLSITSNGNVVVSQTLYITDAIQHYGDNDTRIRFPAADQIQFETAGTSWFNLGSTGAFNFGNNSNAGAKVYIKNGNDDANNSNALALDIQGAWMRIGDAILGNETYNNGIGIKFHDSGVAHWTAGVLSGGFYISNTSNNGNQLFPSTRTDAFFLSSTGNAVFSGDITAGGNLYIPDKIYHVGDTNTYLSFPANDTISFTTSGSERVKIFSNGGTAISNAGSFPTSTNETLTVRGEGHNGHGTSNTRSVFNITAALTSRSVNGGGGLWVGARTNEDTAVVGTRTANGNLAIETHNNGWGERLRITSAGNLLVGKTADSGKGVEIYDSNNAALRVQNSHTGTGTGDGLLIETSFSDALIWNYENANTRFGTNNLERLRISSNGNVEMGSAAGTGADFSLLDGMVINTANGKGGLMVNSSSSSHNAYISFSYGSGSSTSHADQFSAYIGRVGDDNLILGTSNNIRVQVTSSGHVVPGANNTYDLGINATRWKNIYASGIISNILPATASTATQAEFRNPHTVYGGGVRFKSNNTYGTVEIINYNATASASIYNSTGGWHWTGNWQTHGAVSPFQDSSHDLGSNAKRWRTAYLDTLNVSDSGNNTNGTVANFRGGVYNQINIAHANNSGWGLLLTNTDQSTYGSNAGYHFSSNTSVNSPCAVVNVNSDALHFATGNTSRWYITHGGNFLPFSNGQVDIGAGTARVRNIHGQTLSLSSYATIGAIVAADPGSAYYSFNHRIGSNFVVRGTSVLTSDIGGTKPSTFPAPNVQLMVYNSTNGQPITNEACARLLIATDAKQTGAQGYHGTIDFGSSDCTASGSSAEFNYRCASIMCRGDGDTSSSAADGDLQFFTKQANVGLMHRFDIAPNGTLTGTDTNGIGSLSDQRLKTNIQDYTYDLNKFKQLKTRTFDWINPKFHEEGNIRGFIAQEIETVDPYWNYQFEVSKENAEEDYDLLSDGDENYTIRDHRPAKASKLNGKDAMYVSVIQQLMSKIETLETKVAALEGS